MAQYKELCGKKFSIVQYGLDQNEVSAFIESIKKPQNDIDKRLKHLEGIISELSNQCRQLFGKIEHIDSSIKDSIKEQPHLDKDKLQCLESLTIFAENTIIEAGKYAESIKTNASHEAKANADVIVHKAEEKAQKIIHEAKEQALGEAMKVKKDVEQLLIKTHQLVRDNKNNISTENATTTRDVKSCASNNIDNAKMDCCEVSVTEDPLEQTPFAKDNDNQTDDYKESSIQMMVVPNAIFSRD